MIVSCRNVRYLVVYGLLLWFIHKNKHVVISVSIASLCRPEVINRIVAVSKMTTTMLGAGHKNVTIFHETTGHTSCCLNYNWFMLSCFNEVMLPCCNQVMQQHCWGLCNSCTFISNNIISPENVIQWKNVEHTFKNHHFAKFLLNGWKFLKLN